MSILTDERQHQEWMNKLLVEARILAPEFPCKGETGWLPYGFSIADKLVSLFSEKIGKIGFEEILLPSFVKGEIFLEQCNNIKDFRKRVYWSDPFEKGDSHVVKPTIEAQISALFSNWLKKGIKPPYKYFTCRSVGRYETGRTLPLWKERVVWPFFEGHSMHINEKDLVSTINSQNRVLKEVYDLLGLPIFLIQRPKINKRLQEYSERRLESISVTPYKRVVILSSIYDLGEIFSKVYSLKSKEGNYYPMVNFAFSGRLIGTVFSNFCDETGLRLPSIIAPHHLRLIAIDNKSEIQKKLANGIIDSFKKSDMRVNFDDSSNSFKEKVMKAKIQGVPLIALIGDKEVKSKTVTIIRRDINKEEVLKLNNLIPRVKDLLRKSDATLKEWAYANLREIYTFCSNKNELPFLAKKDKLIEISLCEEEDCLKKLEGVNEIEVVGSLVEGREFKNKNCICCGKSAKQQILLGKKWKGEK